MKPKPDRFEKARAAYPVAILAPQKSEARRSQRDDARWLVEHERLSGAELDILWKFIDGGPVVDRVEQILFYHESRLDDRIPVTSEL